MLVRTRYAPSPTGAPHLGNIRTALFNFLFARGLKGQFIVRIEDTDRQRLVEGSTQHILESLAWLGMEWDEGPDKGGPYAPYVQSERLETYREAVQKLVEKKMAYPCFCTQDRLSAMRKRQEAKHEPPRYDRSCLTIPPDEVKRRLEKGEQHVIRLKIPSKGKTSFHDLIRGVVEFDNTLLDDQVLLKSDSYPTYHLAVVVDDHAMGITHVIRAEEWISSTPKHLLLYQFFEWTPPIYAHVPMVMDEKKAKLSKRRGARAVLEYREAGYLPGAVVNYLSTLGWTHPNEEKILSIEELASAFSLGKIKKSPAVFNEQKMNWLNGVAIRQLTDADLFTVLEPFLNADWDREIVRKLIPLVKERITTLSDFNELCHFFFVEPEISKKTMADAVKGNVDMSVLRETANRLSSIDWSHDALEQSMRKLAEEKSMQPADLFMLLRVSISGKTITPPLFESMVILGKDTVLHRLSKA